MLERPNYSSLKDAIRSIRELLEEHGDVVNFDVPPPPYPGGLVHARAYFMAPHFAKAAAQALSDYRHKPIGNRPLRTTHVQSLSYTLPANIFALLRNDIDRLRELALIAHDSSTISFHFGNPDQNCTPPVFLRLMSDDLSTLSRLKNRFETLLRGEDVREDGEFVWDPLFATQAGVIYLRGVERQNRPLDIQIDPRIRKLTLFGPASNRAKVREILIAEVTRLRNLKIRIIPLVGRLIRVFMDPQILSLQERVGPENIRLDSARRVLIVRGDDNLHDSVQEVVTRLQEDHPGNRSLTDAECPVCLGEPTVPVTLSCGHSWCKSCLVSYLLSASDTMFPLACLGYEATCSSRISLHVAQKHLSTRDFEKVAHSAFLSHVHSHPSEFYYCPTPDCPEIYRTAPPGTVVQCPSCLIRICPHCHVEYHEDITCADREDGYEALFKEWTDTHNVKPCPGCKSLIEKAEGCNHMTCIRCQTHTCWVCLETFPKGDGIYDHMELMHGGSGL
ncbi:hypothetical protein JAAARDRAFT_125982 [Jaapia argillacea MUCL 33604]|uniref:RBR-type E3 ubiquitin transferase n=1 Tax=Jaapia argillacea MUCL 33604 TaxID=933084 RepID=A0A067Q299_9AGAM|nr:hypothetical protein JAAARDRAFT_125982 [Jaapia argillacea MUCL 33604]